MDTRVSILVKRGVNERMNIIEVIGALNTIEANAERAARQAKELKEILRTYKSIPPFRAEVTKKND